MAFSPLHICQEHFNMTPPSSRRKCINILRWCYLQSHKTPTLNSLFKDSFRKNFSTYLRKRDPVFFFFFSSFKLPSVPSPYMLNAYGKNYRYMIICMFQSLEPVFFLFPFFSPILGCVCVCMCLCVCVDEKHFSCDTLFGTSYGIFHSFYMFDILAKPVRRGSQLGELQYLAFNNYCQYNSWRNVNFPGGWFLIKIFKNTKIYYK